MIVFGSVRWQNPIAPSVGVTKLCVSFLMRVYQKGLRGSIIGLTGSIIGLTAEKLNKIKFLF